MRGRADVSEADLSWSLLFSFSRPSVPDSVTLPHFRLLLAASFGDDDRVGDYAQIERDGKPEASPFPKARPLLDPAEEAPLLRRLQGADEGIARSAFTAIYEAYAPALWRFVMRLTQSPAEAEEIVQDVFTSVWTSRSRWNPASGVAAYLFRAVRNRAIDVRRHATVVARIGDDPALFSVGLGTAPHTPEASVVQEELRHAVRAALAALPERRRTALVLRYLHGMSYAQIALVLGTTEKAAFILVARTREALREVLQKFS
jgi:RNA polymerase sigma-70 factor (ECF subfamily)